jgi:DNA repair protein RadC
MNEIKVVVVRERAMKSSAKSITGPRELCALLKRRARTLDREVFWVVHLNVQNIPLSFETVSVGTVSSTLVHPRETLKSAILLGASSIILAHNHPSGNPEASEEDIELTKRMVKVGDLVGIPVLDHVIITSQGSFTSLRETKPKLFTGRNYND